MTFCVECGAEGKTYEALCGRCFARKRPMLAATPAFVDVRRCTHCGRLEVGGSWVEAELDDILPEVLAAAVPRTGSAAEVAFTHVSRPEDDRNWSVSVTATGRHDDLELAASFETRARIRGATCPTCSRKRAHYFESIVQLRAQDRDLTEEERSDMLGLVASIVARRQGKGEEVFVSKIEDVRGGTDVYLSHNNLGREVARELGSTFGGTVGSSPTLYGRRKGKDLYRVTFVVRLP